MQFIISFSLQAKNFKYVKFILTLKQTNMCEVKCTFEFFKSGHVFWNLSLTNVFFFQVPTMHLISSRVFFGKKIIIQVFYSKNMAIFF